ncbi:MAG: glycosyltransferase family 39 protein [Anaerolineae bacterium]|nr:glycosyltransferase family 39 protein [Anaerolineae bacterium]
MIRATVVILKRHKWIVLVTLIGLLLRLYQLGEWSFWHDEALTVLLARQPVPQLIAITATDVHPPLYFLIVKLFLNFGQNEIIVRLPGVLFGAAAVVTIYWLGCLLFDERVGLMAAVIMAVSPLQLFYAQEARLYTQLLLLTLLSSCCFFQALRTDRYGWWAVFVVTATLAAYTAYFAFPIFAAMALYVFLIERQRQKIFHFLVAMVVVGLLYLPWVGVFIAQTRAVADTYWIAQPSPLVLFTTLSGFFISYTLPSFWIAVSLVTTLLIIFVVLNDGRHIIWRRHIDTKPLLWLLLWGFIPLVGTFLISLIQPIFQLRTVLTASPAFYILVAWGTMRSPQRRVNGFLFLPTVALMLFSLFNFYFNPAFEKPAWRAAATYVNTHTQPGDVVLHTSDSSFLPFLAYPHQVPHILLPLDPDEASKNAPSQSIISAVGGTPQPLETSVQGYNRAWLVMGIEHSADYQVKQKRLFDSRYHVLDENKIDGIYIFTYALDEVNDDVEAGR